jgi:hypothetical protein
MGNVRGTLFFVDHTSWRATGWSETHYFASNSLSLTEAIVRLDAYAPLRQALLAPGIAVTYARVSDDTVFRDSQITAGYRPLLPVALTATNLFPIDAPPPSSGAPGPNILPGNPLFANDPSDMAWTAVLMRGEAGAPFIGRSMFWIAGLPDNLTFSFNRGITDATWKGAFDTWANFLTQNFAFLGQDNSNANPPKNITMAHQCELDRRRNVTRLQRTAPRFAGLVAAWGSRVGRQCFLLPGQRGIRSLRHCAHAIYQAAVPGARRPVFDPAGRRIQDLCYLGVMHRA